MKELGTEEVCLALGYFDSVHMGHRKLISVAAETAKELKVGCCVATFSNNAYKLFNMGEKQVYTYIERCMLLDGLCDYVLPMRFDTRLKNLPAERFLDELFARHRIKAVVCGYDYLFGAGIKGDAEYLKKYCDSHCITCTVVPKYELNGTRVSTTEVKALLRSGELERANEILGEPFMMTGKVVHGRGAGRMFNIPTANIRFSNTKLLPANGVYGTVVEVDGKTYYGVTNVGGRPTFGLTKTVVETMLCDFNDNIYDKTIKITFRKYLRPIQKFETPVELSKQIHKDTEWYVHD